MSVAYLCSVNGVSYKSTLGSRCLNFTHSVICTYKVSSPLGQRQI